MKQTKQQSTNRDQNKDRERRLETERRGVWPGKPRYVLVDTGEINVGMVYVVIKQMSVVTGEIKVDIGSYCRYQIVVGSHHGNKVGKDSQWENQV